MTEKRNEKSFEEKLARLNELVEILDSDEVKLDEIISFYKEGIELMGQCTENLSVAQKTLKELRKRSDGMFELLDAEEN